MVLLLNNRDPDRAEIEKLLKVAFAFLETLRALPEFQFGRSPLANVAHNGAEEFVARNRNLVHRQLDREGLPVRALSGQFGGRSDDPAFSGEQVAVDKVLMAHSDAALHQDCNRLADKTARLVSEYRFHGLVRRDDLPVDINRHDCLNGPVDDVPVHGLAQFEFDLHRLPLDYFRLKFSRPFCDEFFLVRIQRLDFLQPLHPIGHIHQGAENSSLDTALE